MFSLTLSQIIDGYLLHAAARRLSNRTIQDYTHTYRLFQTYLAAEHTLPDPPFVDLTKRHLETFLASQTVSNKTLLNYHIGLSALWTWAYNEGYTPQHLPRQIAPPKPTQTVIIPFTQTEVKALLDSLNESAPYRRQQTVAAHTLPNRDRNRAIILLLIDTGLRAEELCTASIHDLNLKNLYLRILGKGNKERIIPISSRTAQTLWKYLSTRPTARPDEPLFVTLNDAPFDRHRLVKQLHAIARRAGVTNVHPHRFRHTFAITYLRNGGNIYTLQMILGHSTLDMVKKYLNLAQTDLQSAHRLASPVSNWRL